MALYCGIDLHSNNSVVVVIDERDRRLVEKRIPNELGRCLELLEPYRAELLARIEKRIRQAVKPRPAVKRLQTVRGIGDLLAQTIDLEVGDIARFKKVGCFASYCRCVKSERRSTNLCSEGNRRGAIAARSLWMSCSSSRESASGVTRSFSTNRNAPSFVSRPPKASGDRSTRPSRHACGHSNQPVRQPPIAEIHSRERLGRPPIQSIFLFHTRSNTAHLTEIPAPAEK